MLVVSVACAWSVHSDYATLGAAMMTKALAVVMVGEHTERPTRIGKRNGVVPRCRVRGETEEKRR